MGWELLVVATYGRLFELVPSVKHEDDRWKPRDARVGKWPGMGGRALEPLFPGVVERMLRGKKWDFTLDMIRRQIPWHVPLKI